MKKSLIGLSTAAAVIMTAGVSLAALPNLDAGNTTMATELVSPTQDTPAPATFIAYQVNGAVAPTTTLKFTLANGTFVTGSTWDLCSIDAALNITKHTLTSAATAEGATSVNVQLDPAKNGLGVGTIYYLEDNGCAAVPAATNSINVLAGTTAGHVDIAVDSVTTPGDPKIATSTTIVTLKDELSAFITPVVSKMDFATGRTTLIQNLGTGDFPQTLDTANGSDAIAKLVIVDDGTIQNKINYLTPPDKACTGTMDPNDVFKLKLTGNLTGVDQIVVNAQGLGATTTYDLTAADYTNGFATVTVPGDAIGICSTANPDANSATGIALVVDTTVGTTKAPALVAGDITTEVKLVGENPTPLVPGRANATRVLKTAVSHTIAFNGTAYYLELVRADATRETYVKLQSKNTTLGANGVSIQVLANDGTLVKFTPAQTSGTIAAGTPFVVTGSEMAAAVAAAGKAVSADGFAAIITVNAPEADVFGYANVLDATGSKRVPLKTVGGTIVE